MGRKENMEKGGKPNYDFQNLTHIPSPVNN
jgi:hypothetical protein